MGDERCSTVCLTNELTCKKPYTQTSFQDKISLVRSSLNLYSATATIIVILINEIFCK